MVRALSYRVPRTRWLHRLCKMYVDNFHGDNNADMNINGELRFLRIALGSVGEKPVVFDIGANRGDWCEAALTIRPQANIHCFEPARWAWQQLTARGFPANVTCNAAGMGDRPGTLKLYVNPGASELSSVYAGSDQGGLGVEVVPILTVDSYCQERGIVFVDYMKIDVEGHEFAVMKGAAEMLNLQRIRFVQFEYGSWYIHAGVFLRDVFQFVKGFNYEVCKIVPWGLEPVRSYSPNLERFENAYYVLVLRGATDTGRKESP
jgi:FkbM family methyltransferase